MNPLPYLRRKLVVLPYPLLSVIAAIAAFGAYTSMYAFRKAFSAGTFEGDQLFGIDYKVWLVIAQVIGYTFSKFYGIRFIAEIDPKKRGRSILVLIGISWLALLAFAIIPAPYNIVCLFLNGFPLGMIWGLVFGYLEGRKSTEFMAAVMSISMIFASGFVKTVGRSLITVYGVNEFLMPFLTGLIFALPLLLFVLCLEAVPPPTAEDRQLRVARSPMTREERSRFLKNFFPGMLLTLIIYVLLTMMRDVRDNFEVEIWKGLGETSTTIYSKVDTLISVVVLLIVSLLILVRNNLLAFSVIHLLIIFACLLIGGSTLLYQAGTLSPVNWMIGVGLGLYLGYVPYNTIFFERLIATFRCQGNAGFVMYVADAAGYLGSTSILLIKELGNPQLSWTSFFEKGVLVVAVVGAITASCSLLYFRKKAKNDSYQAIAGSLKPSVPVSTLPA